MQVNQILVPNKPQLDVIAAIYLLGQYGQDKFPGIDKADIIFWDKAEDPTNEDIERFRNEGVMLIDVSGTIFDHHDTENGVHETATSLVAQYLEIDKKPELSTLLTYIREDDLAGLHNRYGELVHVLKCMYKQNMDQTEVIQYALQSLHIMQTSQREWHVEVKKEFEDKVKLLNVKRYKRKLKVGVIETDNVMVGNYGLIVGNLAVILQKRSTGHVMILTNKNHKIDLRESIAAIRKRELELKNYSKPIEIGKLKFEGKSMLVPNWFYHRSLNAFLNGSDALSNTDPTAVPFDDIIRFVAYGISTDDSELCDCHNGSNNCPYVDYGFSKCYTKKNFNR